MIYDHVWRWNGSWWRPIYRKGQRCRIVKRGAMNTVLVEFEDGFRVTTAKWAVKPAPVNYVPTPTVQETLLW